MQSMTRPDLWLILMSLVALFPAIAFAGSDDWKQLTSAADVAEAHPERMRALIERLDLDRPGLADVRSAWQADDLDKACEALVEYYRTCDSGAWLREVKGEPGERTREIAGNAVNDRFEQQGTVDQVPRGEDGRLDWTYTGPKDDFQFAVFLNRHHYFNALVTMWHGTAEAKYAQAVDRLVKDWVLAHGQAPAEAKPRAVWTPLNPGIRMSGPWPRAFYGLQQADALTPAARLLLLSTVPEHAAFLQDHLRAGHNFATMQMNGLGTIGAAFPEFKKADHWRNFAIEQVLRELETQVYPDGVQKELTASYHWVSLSNFAQLANNLRSAGHDVPTSYRARLEKMYAYLADAMRPTGALPLNNDSDLGDFRGRLSHAADTYERPDWRYIATQGEEGERPNDPPSRYLPWAGQLISRSGWRPDSHWSFFDIGPYGVSHQHNDALHLSINAFGRDVLVDSGRFAYQGSIAEKFRIPYTFHSRAHNVILLDGMGQQATELEADAPHPWARVSQDADLAFGRFTNGYDSKPTNAINAWNGLSKKEMRAEQPGQHSRAVIYVRDRGWLVFDRVEAEGEHTISPLWHFHPDCNVTAQGSEVMSTDQSAGNVRITPAGEVDWRVDIVKGQEEPTLQGWYSPTYGEVQPAPCAVYEATMRDQATFAWVINPARDTPEPVSVQWLKAPAGAARLGVDWPDGTSTVATVAFDEAGAIDVGDGRTLIGRALVETDGAPPRVMGGRLLDSSGAVIDADVPDAEAFLTDLLEHVDFVRQPTGDASLSWALSMTNVALDQPIHISAASADDAAGGWQVKSNPPKLELSPGETKTVTIRAAHTPGQPRYPLPELVLEASASASSGEASARRRQRLPIIGTRPPLNARRASKAPAIDGKLDDAIWQRQAMLADLAPMNLDHDVSPGTRVWAAYDDQALYLAFHCEEPKTDQLKLDANAHDAGDIWRDDSVEVLFNPDGDNDRYYHIMLNAAGVAADARAYDTAADLSDLQTGAAIGERVWTAEIAIPWSSLGLQSPTERARLLLARNRWVTGKQAVFQFPLSPGGNHQLEHFAPLRFSPSDD